MSLYSSTPLPSDVADVPLPPGVTVGRVAEVLAKLPSNFSLLKVHDWIPVANTHPTFRAPRYA